MAEAKAPKTLLVTNDYPPRLGGIQTYLQNYVDRLAPEQIMVYTSTHRRGDPGSECQLFDAAQPYQIVRYPGTMMLPTPAVKRKMQELIRTHEIDTVWFGAAAPLGLLGPAAKEAGAKVVLATTHGHEVGWSMLPGARTMLKRIFAHADVVSYISDYTRRRLRNCLGDVKTQRLPGGIDTVTFHPDAQARTEIRERLGIGEAPMVLCLSRLVRRKGQDQLIRVWPQIVARFPQARLVIVGKGPYEKHLKKLALRSRARANIIFTGPIPAADLPRFHAAADVFAMPCRTRFGGLDVEGLGIVYLEASAAGVPVIAGNSGGAPETVVPARTGWVVNGWSRRALKQALTAALSDPQRARDYGEQGRLWAESNWTWPTLIARLQAGLRGMGE